MGSGIQAQDGQHLDDDRMAFRHKRTNHLGHGDKVREDDEISDEMMIFDDLALFFPTILSNHAFTAKEHPAPSFLPLTPPSLFAR